MVINTVTLLPFDGRKSFQRYQQPQNRDERPQIVNKMVYIRQDKLPKLKEYKYSAVDHSLVSRYILKPFYTNVVINFFPTSMA